MQELPDAIILFCQLFLPLWLGCYVALLALYITVGLIVSRYNSACLSNYRIQTKECPEALVKRDIKQSVKSLVTISAMLAAGISLREAGFNLDSFFGFETAPLSWYGLIGWAIASLILFDTWFYWAHRLIHHKRLYVRIHRWHHRSSTPTVWANNSDTFLDNIFCQSYWFFAPLLLPVPTIILLLHKTYDQITGMIGHAGYEYAPGPFSAKPSPMIGTSFHDLHHSGFHYNFATHFSVWDRLMGTLHPNYDEMILAFPNKAKDASQPQSRQPEETH